MRLFLLFLLLSDAAHLHRRLHRLVNVIPDSRRWHLLEARGAKALKEDVPPLLAADIPQAAHEVLDRRLLRDQIDDGPVLDT